MRDVAILIDGGFFIKRLKLLGYLSSSPAVEDAMRCFRRICDNHLSHLNRRYGLNFPGGAVQDKRALLYRTFFYDAPPFAGNASLPISKTQVNFSRTEQALFRHQLFEELRKSPSVALRLGELAGTSRWVLNQHKQKSLLKGDIAISDLVDSDFHYDLNQKGVDMRIGLDIATLALKRQVQTIVLVTGDADFVPAAKLARREGLEVILDPLRNNISKDLFEHIDGLRHGLPKAEIADDDTSTLSGDMTNN